MAVRWRNEHRFMKNVVGWVIVLNIAIMGLFGFLTHSLIQANTGDLIDTLAILGVVMTVIGGLFTAGILSWAKSLSFNEEDEEA